MSAPTTITPHRSPPKLLTLVAIAGMSALTMNLFLPSLTSIATWFQADYALAQLAISGYLATTAVLQVFVGPLSDRYGRRPVLLGTLVVFILATIGCLLAQDIHIFLIFRMLQAAIVTGIVLSRAVIRDIVDASQAASMIGYVTMGMSLAPMIGPAIGGWLDDWFGWQASFVMLLALGGIVLIWVWVDLGETNHHRSSSFAAQFRAYPELLKSPRFWGYTLTASFASGVFFAFLGGAPFVAEQMFHMTPSSNGMYFALVSIGYMAGNFLSGRFSQAVGFNRMMLIGAVISLIGVGISLALFGIGVLHPMSLYGPMLIVAVGNGLTLPSANAGIVSVRPHLAGSASGLGGALMTGAGAAVAVIAGASLSESTGVWPLVIIMLMSATFALLSTLRVAQLERRANSSQVQQKA